MRNEAGLETVAAATEIGNLPKGEARKVTAVRDKYCIAGVGETAYVRESNRTTRAMGVEAVTRAMNDAGVGATEVDGLLSYHRDDSTLAAVIAEDLGIRPNFHMDCTGGGSSIEALIGLACGAIEMGMCHTVVVYRSMNGHSGRRPGGSPTSDRPALSAVNETTLETLSYGISSAAQLFQFTFARHMYEFGTTSEQLATVKSIQSRHASNNPKAYYKRRLSVEDVLDSRWIVKPACHLLDCCVETDNAAAIVITSKDRAKDLRQRPIYIMGVVGRVSKPFPVNNMHYQCSPITRTAGHFAKRLIFPNAGVEPKDIDITGCYDAFTFTTLLLFESYGFCEVGEGGEYVSNGGTALGGLRPNNTSGGQLCEGYTHGVNLVIENVRQLRGQADDGCEGAAEGRHTYNYDEGCCRQAKDVEISMNMGWADPAVTSSLILRR
jgi:acetyl-CoA acetyltransferase